MAAITPEQRARMLRSAEQKYRAQGMPGWQAKRAAKEALRAFMEQLNEQEKKDAAAPAKSK